MKNITIGIIARENFPDFREFSRRKSIFPGLDETLHKGRRSFISEQQIQQPFQVGRDQNIHRGGHGRVEGAVAIVDAGGEEIRQYIVGIGGTDETVEREPHALREKSGENVPEVPCGDANIDLFTE